MKNLISGGALTHLNKILTVDEFKKFSGVLVRPTRSNHPNRAVNLDACWAADNDCYVKYDPKAIINMLMRYKNIPNCLFVNSPDVVCNHDATLFLFWFWQPIIKYYNYPVAFTLQNGVSVDTVPFNYCDAIFIGGTTDFKFSDVVVSIVKKSKELNKHVHMGRVNSIKRIKYAKSIGVDSFDGTGYCRWYWKVKEHLPYHTGEI